MPTTASNIATNLSDTIWAYQRRNKELPSYVIAHSALRAPLMDDFFNWRLPVGSGVEVTDVSAVKVKGVRILFTDDVEENYIAAVKI